MSINHDSNLFFYMETSSNQCRIEMWKRFFFSYHQIVINKFDRFFIEINRILILSLICLFVFFSCLFLIYTLLMRWQENLNENLFSHNQDFNNNKRQNQQRSRRIIDHFFLFHLMWFKEDKKIERFQFFFYLMSFFKVFFLLFCRLSFLFFFWLTLLFNYWNMDLDIDIYHYIYRNIKRDFEKQTNWSTRSIRILLTVFFSSFSSTDNINSTRKFLFK